MGILDKDWKEYDEGSWAIRDGQVEIEVRAYEHEGRKRYGWALRQCGAVIRRGELETLLAAQNVAKEAFSSESFDIDQNWGLETEGTGR